MISSPKRDEMIEAAALNGRFNDVEEFMKKKKIRVTSDFLATLFALSLQSDKETCFADIAFLLMEHCDHNVDSIETQLRAMVRVDQFRKLWEIKTSVRHFPQKLKLREIAWFEHEITQAMVTNDFDEMDKYFSSMPDVPVVPTEVLAKVFTQATNVEHLMTVKCVELGMPIACIESKYNTTFTQWSLNNNCEDLLDLPHVKDQLDFQNKEKKRKEICQKTHAEKITDEEVSILTSYLEEPGAFKTNLTMLNFICLTSPDRLEFWQWAARRNQVELMSIPGVMPTKGITLELHKMILDCALNGQNDAVEALVKHAKLHMPIALRFTKQELDNLNAVNSVLAYKLGGAFLNTTPAASMVSKVMSNIASTFTTVNTAGQSYLPRRVN